MAALQRLSYKMIFSIRTVIVRAGQAGIAGLCCLSLA
jgi:hypothetical protein